MVQSFFSAFSISLDLIKYENQESDPQLSAPGSNGAPGRPAQQLVARGGRRGCVILLKFATQILKSANDLSC